MSRDKGTFNFAANFEVLAKAPLDAKQLVGTKADLTGVTTWSGATGVWLYDGAIVSVGSDPTSENNGIYFLSAATNYTDINSWVQVGTGIGAGTITGGTNGLSTAGANVVLGGDLTGSTIIGGGGLHDLTLNNINDFQITPSGNSAITFGVDETGLLYSFTGGSVVYDSISGLVYGGDYTTNYVNESLVSKRYVDTIAAGLHPKTAVLVATTGETLALSGLTTIDGISLSDGDRVLAKDQSNPVDNGIYIVTGITWSRSPDFDGSPDGEVEQGALIPVITGGTLQNSQWILITKDPVVGVSALTFTLFSSGAYIAGIGIDISGNIINVDGAILDGNSLLWSGNTFNVDTETGTLSIALNSKLNESVFTGYTATTQPILDSAFTGATNVGTGEDIYSGTTDNTAYFRTILGSGDTQIITSGDTIIINSDSSILSGATNGLSLTDDGTTVVLGGVLTGATAISAGTNSFAIQGTSTASYLDYIYLGDADAFRMKASSGDFVGAITAMASPTLGRILLCASSGGTNIYSSIDSYYCYITLALKTTGGTNSMSFQNNGSTVFTDNINSVGLEYNADYCSGAASNPRWIPDNAYVTGFTTSASNVVNVCNVTTTYTATTENDFIGVSGASIIYLPPTPKACQRISVADICGNALSSSIIICGCWDVNGQNINGDSFSTINTDYGSMTFINNGVSWSAIAFIN